MSYYEGSMVGSGIYSQDVSYDKFECENEECGKSNEAGDTTTDDYGNYEIVCEFCGEVFANSSTSQDERDYREANYEDEDR